MQHGIGSHNKYRHFAHQNRCKLNNGRLKRIILEYIFLVVLDMTLLPTCWNGVTGQYFSLIYKVSKLLWLLNFM